jgi:L-lactate utilization protein LutC
MQELIDSLRKRNMSGYFVSNKDEALNKALELIPENSSVGFGGSVTLEQLGILDILRERKDIELLDRTKVKDSKRLYELYARMFSCDVFLSSSNAITEKGQIVNVDGRGNRVAAITFGPKKVIIIVGKNKITGDLDAAVERIRKVACPLNVKRLKELATSSPVASSIEITEEKIWGQVSIIERQLDKDRIHVIIVNESLGF